MNLEVSPPVESLVIVASVPLLAESADRQHYAAESVRNKTFALNPHYRDYTHTVKDLTAKVYIFLKHADLGQ